MGTIPTAEDGRSDLIVTKVDGTSQAHMAVKREEGPDERAEKGNRRNATG